MCVSVYECTTAAFYTMELLLALICIPLTAVGGMSQLRTYLVTQDCLRTGVDTFPEQMRLPMLHAACLNGHKDVVKLLLERGADLEEVDVVSCLTLPTSDVLY